MTELSDEWARNAYTDRRGDVEKDRLVLEHERRGVTLHVKELPNGARLSIRVPGALPGGYRELHSETGESFEAVTQEAERRAAQYDQEETISINGEPVLH